MDGVKGWIYNGWRECIENIEKYLYSKEKQWIAVHFHHLNPGMHWLKFNITRWRKDVQNHGCKLIATTSFREPVSRLKSLIFYSGVQKNTLNKWVRDYGAGKWKSDQLGYFLWNFYSPNQDVPFKLSEPDEQRLLTSIDSFEFWEIIESFDIVGFTDNLTGFIDKIEAVTKWKPLKQRRKVNITPKRKKYNITDEQEELMRRATFTETKFYDDLKLKFL